MTKGADIRAAFLSNAGAERVTLRKKERKRVWLILTILSDGKTSRMKILFMTNELTRIPEEKGGGLEKGNVEWKRGFCAECASLKCSKKGILSKSMQFWGLISC